MTRYLVYLPWTDKNRFPHRCVICGKPAGSRHNILNDAMMDIDLFNRTNISVPGHESCIAANRKERIKRGILFFLFILFGGYFPFALIRFGVGAYTAFILLLALISTSVFIISKNQKLPFKFYIYSANELIFSFADKEYAEEFAALNGAVDTEKNIYRLNDNNSSQHQVSLSD